MADDANLLKDQAIVAARAIVNKADTTIDGVAHMQRVLGILNKANNLQGNNRIRRVGQLFTDGNKQSLTFTSEAIGYLKNMPDGGKAFVQEFESRLYALSNPDNPSSPAMVKRLDTDEGKAAVSEEIGHITRQLDGIMGRGQLPKIEEALSSQATMQLATAGEALRSSGCCDADDRSTLSNTIPHGTKNSSRHV